ncbi:MAG: hypothetical protein WCO09_02160 [bacterium]
MKEFKVLGGTDHEKDKGRDALRREYEKNSFAFDGENTKSPQEIKYIDNANNYLSQEMSRLGVNGFEEIKPGQVHFLDEEAWDNRFPGDLSQGCDILGGVCINNEDVRKESEENGVNFELKRFIVMLHELVHFQGCQKFVNVGDTTYSYRHGYLAYNANGEEYHFKMFDEAIVDTVTGLVASNHASDIKRDFGINLEEWDELKKYLNYRGSIALVSHIVVKVAESEGCENALVWDEMMRNHFTGNMMFLRKIEKAYGTKALRLLSMIDFKKQQTKEEDEKQNRLRRYFLDETTDEEREIITRELLK